MANVFCEHEGNVFAIVDLEITEISIGNSKFYGDNAWKLKAYDTSNSISKLGIPFDLPGDIDDLNTDLEMFNRNLADGNTTVIPVVLMKENKKTGRNATQDESLPWAWHWGIVFWGESDNGIEIRDVSLPDFDAEMIDFPSGQSTSRGRSSGRGQSSGSRGRPSGSRGSQSGRSAPARPQTQSRGRPPAQGESYEAKEETKNRNIAWSMCYAKAIDAGLARLAAIPVTPAKTTGKDVAPATDPWAGLDQPAGFTAQVVTLANSLFEGWEYGPTAKPAESEPEPSDQEGGC